MPQGISTIDMSGPSVQQAIKQAGKNGKYAPIGASPGELRLWLKQNGLLDDLQKKSDANAKSKFKSNVTVQKSY
jgi:hypothetical protein